MICVIMNCLIMLGTYNTGVSQHLEYAYNAPVSHCQLLTAVNDSLVFLQSVSIELQPLAVEEDDLGADEVAWQCLCVCVFSAPSVTHVQEVVYETGFVDSESSSEHLSQSSVGFGVSARVLYLLLLLSPTHSPHIRWCPFPPPSQAQQKTDQDLHKDAGFPPNILLNSTWWRKREKMTSSQDRVWKRMSNH